VLAHDDGTEDRVEVRHTMSERHIDWFKAGSALNFIAAQRGHGG
jgi:aconitate hydratase